MNEAELKLNLFRRLDSLSGKTLEEAYGLLTNLISSKTEINDWEEFTDPQRKAILHGLKQLDEGQGREHNTVMKDLRNKFSDA